MNPRTTSGFTLVEISVATSVLIIVITMVMMGLLYSLSSATESDKQSELDISVQAAMERLKQDLRLTSLDKCIYYPDGRGPYTAISFPLARDDDGDGAVDLDASGNIIWDKTLIYHVWSRQPSQLRLTTFDPRPNLTSIQLQEQLNSVVTNGNGRATYGAENSQTEVVFQNLFTCSIMPQMSRLDGYASNLTRQVGVTLGPALVRPGTNLIKFIVLGSNALSGGCAIGLDTITVTPGYGVREAESQPVVAQAGPTPVAQYCAGGDWSGNYYLYFPATATGQYFTLCVENDRWEETNFRGLGSLCENTAIEFDESLSPKDYVVRLQGNTWSWHASEQTGNTTGSVPTAIDSYCGYAVRVLLKGRDMLGGGWIRYDGRYCYVWFEAVNSSSRKLKIDAAYIAECADTLNPTPNIIGPPRRITFSGGANGKTFPDAAGYNWSDRIDFPISREKTYVVGFLIGMGIGNGNPWQWTDATNTVIPHAYLLPAANETNLLETDWISKPNVISTNAILAVRYLWTSYPTNGFYTSPIFDTHMNAPAYSTIIWNATAGGGSLLMRVRTASDELMSDAPAWTNVAPMTTPGAIAPGNRRYVQFQAELRSDADCVSTPTLKDVTIRWPGETRMVDLTATITKGPNFGVFGVEANGTEIKKALAIDLTIFDDVRSFGKTKRITSSLSSEVMPRNTGR